MQGEGVQTAFEFPLQRLVRQPMTCHQAARWQRIHWPPLPWNVGSAWYV